ncbi:MAG: hypothetical protein DI535_16495 [Citrobacter freundii]|nr:MAG: hypothetical protein DI535_16495 [Citrobacter freundii]
MLDAMVISERGGVQMKWPFWPLLAGFGRYWPPAERGIDRVRWLRISNSLTSRPAGVQEDRCIREMDFSFGG